MLISFTYKLSLYSSLIIIAMSIIIPISIIMLIIIPREWLMLINSTLWETHKSLSWVNTIIASACSVLGVHITAAILMFVAKIMKKVCEFSMSQSSKVAHFLDLIWFLQAPQRASLTYLLPMPIGLELGLQGTDFRV